MCLAIPGRVDETYQRDGLPMAKVNFDGIVKEVCLEFLPEAGVGDYVLVHVGLALSRIDEATAQASLATWRELGTLAAELEAAPDSPDRMPPACPLPTPRTGAGP
ncbi:MAG TPA: HypC/HybG/HupF family hydrogenase formation chaperone [Gemmatales bacterium]|nr:HypC/HybG/HupF family hydrogenase formation chaperone [Gemmatales bacterium]HMP60605.1 HypC/HybG/HupF family hydrogenase formation chaperone [Gemmatales bacterium]